MQVLKAVSQWERSQWFIAFSKHNLLVRIHFIIVVIRWTGLAPWEFEFPFPGSLTSTLGAGAEGGVAVGALAMAPC